MMLPRTYGSRLKNPIHNEVSFLMPADSWDLLTFARNVYTVDGEDGIIERILRTLPHVDKWCVEFGAWDGCYTSNTYNLVENCDYNAVLIEGDRKRFGALRRSVGGNARVTAINQFVGFGPDDGLDHILAPLPIPREFDFLSIDID